MHLLLLEPLIQIHFKHVLVLGPLYPALKDLPAPPLGIPHEVNQAFPLVFFRNDQEDQAVLTLINTPRVQQPFAQARGDPLAIRIMDEALFHKRGHIGLSAEINMFSTPGFQRPIIGAKRCDRGGQPALESRLMAIRLEGGRSG